jgi:hypothetical protein
MHTPAFQVPVEPSYPPPVLYAEGEEDPEGVVPDFEETQVDYDEVQDTRPALMPRTLGPNMLQSYYHPKPIGNLPEEDVPSEA